MPSAKEIEDILARQIANSEKLDHEPDCEIDGDQVYKDQLAEINSLKKRTDVLGFDRQSVMDKVKKSVNAYRPTDEKVS